MTMPVEDPGTNWARQCSLSLYAAACASNTGLIMSTEMGYEADEDLVSHVGADRVERAKREHDAPCGVHERQRVIIKGDEQPPAMRCTP